MGFRIAMVAACPFPSPQGSQVFVRQMCERLSAAGHRVHLLTYGHGDAAAAAARSYVHHRLPRVPGDESMRSGPSLVKPLLDALMVPLLVRLVRRERIDLIHAHNYEAALVALAVRRLLGVPVLYHSHNLMGDELPSYFRSAVARRWAGGVGRWLDRTVPRRADHCIALCQPSAAVLLEAGVAAGRMSVIPPAVDDDGPAADTAAARAGLDIDAGAFVVGYTGNVDAYQNLDLLLDAAAALEGGVAGRPLCLLLCSHAVDPHLRARAQEAARGRVKVRIIETSDFLSVRQAIEAADVLALPRRFGSGYPVKLLNYMGAGKPIITAGCGSKIVRDGIDGVVVPDGRPDALAAAVARLAASPDERRELGERARERFVETLVWGAVLPRIEVAYGSILQGCARAGKSGTSLRRRAAAGGSE